MGVVPPASRFLCKPKMQSGQREVQKQEEPSPKRCCRLRGSSLNSVLCTKGCQKKLC